MTSEQEATAAFLNHYLSLGTIVGGIIAVVWICVLLYTWKTNKGTIGLSLIANYALPLGLIVTLGGSFMTLYYSEVLGYLPCGLCWFQRIFLYPMVALFALALMKKDYGIFFYTKWLSLGGLVVALYHNYIQLGYNPLFPCPVTGVFADCAIPPFIEFGFITFPGMAVVLFTFTALLSLTAMRFLK